jgi:hypothetical protein
LRFTAENAEHAEKLAIGRTVSSFAYSAVPAVKCFEHASHH